MGATLGAACCASANMIFPSLGLSIPEFAIVGMAAMVGGATGAAMTAVTMIEMTRDYDIVMPMIVAVALSIGIRRLLSRENIYTIKLVGRGHFIPKALHARLLMWAQYRFFRICAGIEAPRLFDSAGYFREAGWQIIETER